MIKKLLFIPACVLLLVAQGQNREHAFGIAERLGRGINIGNAFEAPAEDEWGNPWNASYFKMIAEKGFTHVRVPIRWETAERSMSSPPYTITPEFLHRIEEVVDSALRYKLHVIINMHHHEALYNDPAGQKERFLSQWYQIADHFRSYPDSLLFEVLNEPHGNLSPSLWNEYFSDALAEIRTTNASRVVVMGIAEYGGLSAVPQIELPPDDNIILSVHYYNPFSFTHQGAEWVENSDPWLGTEWLDTEADRQAVQSEFNYALQFSANHDVPLHIGEFGAYNKADIESRERWTTFLARWFEEKNLSWAYWEFSAGFGIYNPATQQFNSRLVNALLHNELGEPTPVFTIPVYTSNFSSGTDGWILQKQGTADGTAAASGGSLTITIVNGGTESWHVQLVKSNIKLEQDKQYRVSFTADATADRSISAYAGKASSPWDAYSGYNGVGITSMPTTYSFTFAMTSTTDPAARLVFDLGTPSGNVHISEVKVEEITFVDPTPDPEPITSVSPGDNEEVIVYPNPVSSWLWIDSVGNFETATIFDLSGRAVAHLDITKGDRRFDISRLPPGLYLLTLSGNRERVHRKLIKR